MAIFSSFISFSTINIALGVIAFLVLLFIYHIIVTPLSRLNFYKKQGISTGFTPIFGLFSLLKKCEAEHGDNVYYFKNNARQNPDLELEAFNAGTKALVLLYSARLLKAFYSDISYYEKFKSLQPIALFTKWGFPALTGRMFKEHRKSVSSLFSFSYLGQKVPTMSLNAKNVLDGIIRGNELNNVELIKSMFEYTGNNVGDLFFGGCIKNYSVEGKSIVNYTSEIQNQSGILTRTVPLLLMGYKVLSLGLFPSHRRFNEKVKIFRKEVARLINDRKTKIEEADTDLLKVLLETQKSSDPDVAYTDDMIIDEYIVMFVAGAENPSHTLVNALYLLSTHPEYKQQILNEISEIYDKEPLSTQTLQKMTHLHGLIQETLRLHSPSASIQPRVASQDFTVENYQIKKGTLMMPVFLHNNHSEKIFEDAFKFKPERWVNGNISLEPFKFIPFSAGQRNCVGQHYAQIEMKVMICEFLKKFDYTIPADYQLKKTQRFLNVPLQNIPFNLKLRETN